MKNFFTALFILLLISSYAVTVLAQKPIIGKAQPSISLPPELDRVLRDYETAWSSRNPQKLAALFAEDGYVMPGGRPPVKGRAAIEQYYTGQGGPLLLRAFAFAMEGNVGYILGGYAVEKGKNDIGKFTLTLRKGAYGRWLIMSDMDNGN